MTAENGPDTVSEAAVAGFAEKLDAWSRELTPAEQTLLERLITRAAASDDEGDTRGYIIVQNGFADRGIIIVGGRPGPLLLGGLGLSSLKVDGGGGVGRL